MQFDGKRSQQMSDIEKDVIQLLMKYNAQRVEAWVAAFALARCCRPLLERLEGQNRELAIETVVAYITRADVKESDAGRIIRLM